MSIPDIEKEFGLSSSSAGIIMASNDIAGIVLVPLISFWGTHAKKPKWLGYGSIITGERLDSHFILIILYCLIFCYIHIIYMIRYCGLLYVNYIRLLGFYDLLSYIISCYIILYHIALCYNVYVILYYIIL